MKLLSDMACTGAQCVLIALGCVLAASAFCAEAPPMPVEPAPVPASDFLTISAAEFRSVDRMIEVLAGARDSVARADHARELRKCMISDPAKAVLWELWLEGKRTQFAGRKEVLEALPKYVRQQAIVVGRYCVDMEAFYKWNAENDEEFVDTEETKKEFMKEFERMGQIRFNFYADGTVKIGADDDKHPGTGPWMFESAGGRFSVTMEDKEIGEVHFLRGMLKDGEVYLKFPLDDKANCFPYKLKRMDAVPRLALATLMEPMVRVVEAVINKPLNVPPSFAGEYNSEDDSMSLTISPTGAMTMVFQDKDGVKHKPFSTGQATRATEARVEFDCEIDFFAATTDSRDKEEFCRFPSTFEQKGLQLTQTFKDENEVVQTVVWIKVK